MPQTKQQQRQTDRPISPVLSLVLFLQLAQLSPLLTQLVGQPKDFSLSTTAYYKSTGMLLNLLQKPVFHLVCCQKWKLNIDSCLKVKNRGHLQKSQKSDSDLLGGSWSTRGWIFLWSLKLGHLLLFCKLFFLSAVALFISCRVETYLQGINYIPTLLLIVFDWAGNQSWIAFKVWLVPAAWNW